MLPYTTILILILLGLFVAFLTSMVGLGGGVLFIPILILLFNIPPDMAIGTSIFCMTMNTFSSSIGYARQHKIDWRLSVAFDIFDIPGIMVGAYLTTIIPLNILEIICGIAITTMGGIVVFKKSKELEILQKPNEENNKDKNKNKEDEKNSDSPNRIEKQEESNNNNKRKNMGEEGKNREEELNKIHYDLSSTWKGGNAKWVIFSSFLGGLMTGMVGLGGGTVDTTTMVLLGVPMGIAAGSSHFAMLLTNIVGLGSHVALGHVLWDYALPMGIAVFVGAQWGTHYSKKVKSSILRKMLGGVAMLTGIRLLL